HLFDIFDLRGENVEHRLDAGVGERPFFQRLLAIDRRGRLNGRGGRRGGWRRGGRRRALGGGDRDLAAGELARGRFQPGAILLELGAQRAVLRREGEDRAVPLELDLLRLRDDGPVEEFLALADLAEKRLLERRGIHRRERRRVGGRRRGWLYRRRCRPALL